MLKTIMVVHIANMFLDAIAAENILEVGCGGGGIIGNLHGLNHYGIDMHEPSLVQCNRNYPKVQIVQGNILNLSDYYMPKSIDVVTGWDVLEHLTEEDGEILLSQAEGIARKALMWWGPIEDIPTHCDDSRPEMNHVRCLKWEDFYKKGYEVIVFPHYFIGEPILGDGFLAFKRVDK